MKRLHFDARALTHSLSLSLQTYTDPEDSSLMLPEFLDNRHMKMIRLSAIRTGRLYTPPPRKYHLYSPLLTPESIPGP